MGIARGLGFVFLIYFLPVFVRDIAGQLLPGGGILALLRGTSMAPANATSGEISRPRVVFTLYCSGIFNCS